MTTLLLRLAGPLQAWGVTSRFARRTTERAPSRSGVLGMIAAAQGRRRTDSLTDLIGLRFGVRLDQPGRMERDYQTARNLDGSGNARLSTRYYLADAMFVAGIQGDHAIIAGIEDALRHPAYPLYLGRRSCPPAGPVVIGTREEDLYTTLETEPLRASPVWARRQPRTLEVELLLDDGVVPTGKPQSVAESHRDIPVSFDPERRLYDWRRVVRSHVTLTNAAGVVADASSTAAAAHLPAVFEE